MYHFLQKLISSLRPSSTKANLLQRVPPSRFLPFLRNLQNRKTPKGPPFQFFRHCANFFFENFQFFKRVPPSDFLIFCNRKYVNESQKVPRFHFSALCDVFEVFFKNFFQKKFSRKFSKIFLFPVEKSDFPVISSMKGTLWVSRKCFQSFS